MKKYFLLMAMLVVCIIGFSQKRVVISEKKDEEKDHSFKQENIFLGGSVGLGVGNGSFSVGGNPEIGYSVAKWLDAGFIFNINYYSFTAESNGGVRQRSFNYGAGIFTRFYPINNLFLTVIPEYNIIKTNLKDIAYNYTGETLSLKQEAPSLILGVGYGSHDIGSGSFYTMIGFDAGNNIRSPYIGSLGSKLPIIRAGFNIYLSKKKQ